MGLSIQYYVFGRAGLASLITNIIAYGTMCLAPKSNQNVWVFVISGLTLACSQIHKQIYNYGVNGLDVPMNLMFNYCRITSLACCIRDG